MFVCEQKISLAVGDLHIILTRFIECSSFVYVCVRAYIYYCLWQQLFLLFVNDGTPMLCTQKRQPSEISIKKGLMNYIHLIESDLLPFFI